MEKTILTFTPHKKNQANVFSFVTPNMEQASTKQRGGVELHSSHDYIQAEVAPAELSRKGILKTWRLMKYAQSQQDFKMVNTTYLHILLQNSWHVAAWKETMYKQHSSW